MDVRLKTLMGTALLSLAIGGAAYAGGFSRGTADTDILYEDGNFNMRSGVTYVSPHREFSRNPNPRLVGTRYTEDYVIPSAAIKINLSDNLRCAGTFVNNIGGSAKYEFPAASGKVLEEFTTYETAATCALGFDVGPGRLWVLGGGFSESLDYLRRDSYAAVGLGEGVLDLTGQKYGYRIGAAYEIPEIALRGQIMYRSGTNYGAEGTATAPAGLLLGIAEPGTPLAAYFQQIVIERGLNAPVALSARGTGDLPQSVELKFQTGIAPDWLAFGAVKWTGWSSLTRLDVRSVEGDVLLLSDKYYWRDGWTVTGGLGPSKDNEGFTADYDLPNDTAYAETCASVALAFWANRMLGMGPNRRYADVMEQAIYNGAISGISLDGSLFFYENPLESRGNHNRWKWHRCPCCPPNLGRMVASIGSYMYGQADGEIAVHLYGDSTARLDIGGKEVRLTQTTRYPWDGAIAIAVDVDAPTRFALSLRIPGWCRKASLKVNGEAVDLAAVTVDGYARLDREWKAGDSVALDLEMAVERIHAHPEVRQDAGRVTLKRGPLVYCLEGIDNKVSLNRVALPADAPVEARYEGDLLGGIVTLSAKAKADATTDWGGALYRTEPPKSEEVAIKAVPYFIWDNRTPGEMLVWLRGG